MRRFLFALLALGLFAAPAAAQFNPAINKVPSFVDRSSGKLPATYFNFANFQAWAAGQGWQPSGALTPDTRASTGLALTQSNGFQTFAAGVPRITNLGWTYEPARTNSVLWNTDLSNAAWTLAAGMTATNGQASPDGGTTGTLINNGTSTNSHQNLAASISFVSGTTYSFPLYIKPGTGRYLQMTGNGTASVFSSSNYVNFDTTTDTVTASSTIVSASMCSTACNMPSGWHKAVLTVTAAASASAFGFQFSIIPASNTARTASFTGSSETMTVWAPQRDICSSAAACSTSPILTTTVAVTRAADVSTVLATGVQREVIIFSDGTTQSVTGINPALGWTIPTTLNETILQSATGYLN